MKFKKIIKKYFSPLSCICMIFAVVSAGLLVTSKLSPYFADWFNYNISSFCRLIISKITGVLPFSLGEAAFLSLPLFLIVSLIVYFKVCYNDEVKSGRFVVSMVSFLCAMFTSFVFMFGTGYYGTPLADKLGLNVMPVSYDDLEHTAVRLVEVIEGVIDDVDYRYDGVSQMPYSFGELNDKLNDAYIVFAEKNPIIPELRSNVKILAVSPIMTYTHISGVFTYYTGEANINVNYPDYSLPYTMAHEMAHQRGVAPENEANFIAFLVCMESDDPYIRYSGAMSMFEYVLSAMHKASPEDYRAFLADTDLRIKGEMIGFSKFFDRYRDSVASKVTDTINDAYLKANGEKSGSQSYGLVVDLACAYYAD